MRALLLLCLGTAAYAETAAFPPVRPLPQTFEFAFSPDYRLLAAAGLGNVLLYTLPELKPVRTIKVDYVDMSLAFSPDGKQLLVAGPRKGKEYVSLVRVEDGEILKEKKVKPRQHDDYWVARFEAAGVAGFSEHRHTQWHGEVKSGGTSVRQRDDYVLEVASARGAARGNIGEVVGGQLWLSDDGRYVVFRKGKGDESGLLDFSALSEAAPPAESPEQLYRKGLAALQARDHVAALAALGLALRVDTNNKEYRAAYERAVAMGKESSEARGREIGRQVAAEKAREEASRPAAQPAVRFASDLHREAMSKTYQERAQNEVNTTGRVSDDTRKGLEQYR